jgi:hypothetical protein
VCVRVRARVCACVCVCARAQSKNVLCNSWINKRLYSIKMHGATVETKIVVQCSHDSSHLVMKLNRISHLHASPVNTYNHD